MRIYLLLSFLLIAFNMSTAQINDEHLNVGETAPLIQGTDQNGKQINSESVLKDHKILLIFYRGNWCPYCRKHLKDLQDNLEALRAKGYFVLVVSPEKVEKTEETAKMFNVGFSILHDSDNRIMNDYKVAFEVNKENVPAYFNATRKVIAEYNEAYNNVLPVPATYIIGKDGKIAFVHYDPDYTKRFDIEKLLAM
ncbi:MAG: AhpC/TSA family protein [Flavobacteriaceae bacterium]|nr:AhpC/TSA family protein [Flavobacteriaceae bacterium]